MRRKQYVNTGDPNHKWYSEAYDQGRMRSEILRGKSTMRRNLDDEKGLRSELNQLIGLPGKDGMWFYAEGNKYLLAQIPAIREQIKEVENQFKRWRQQRINEGYASVPNKPENYPPELKKKLQALEAKEDVCLEEVAWLEKALSKFANQANDKASIECLQWGCNQMGKLNNGVLSTLDFQHVGIKNGVLVIDDENSPYDGMLVADYRNVVVPLFRASQKVKEAAILLQMQEKAKIDGNPLPTQFLLPTTKVSKSSLPPWPEGVLNHKNDLEEKPESTNEPVKRTKSVKLL